MKNETNDATYKTKSKVSPNDSEISNSEQIFGLEPRGSLAKIRLRPLLEPSESPSLSKNNEVNNQIEF